MKLWEILLEVGQPYGIKPIGLGARDTLRLEAGLPLYGYELSREISPVEAGLERLIKFDKDQFVGKSPLLEQHLKGTIAGIAGLEMTGRGIPRSKCLISVDNRNIGSITSGTYCPSLAKNMAMALINREYHKTDQQVMVQIRENS